MARTDDKLRTVRLQIIDEITGEPLEYVNVRTNAKSVSLSDGTFLEDIIKTMKTSLGNVQVSDARMRQLLEEHLNSSLHADASKLQDAFIGMTVNKENGVVKFLRYDGTTFEWDTTLEHIPLDVTLDKKTGELVLITDKNPAGVRVDLSKFIDVFEGEVVEDTTTKVTSDNHIIVHLNKKGVKLSHLDDDLQEFVKTMNDFLLENAEKLAGIEEGANNYVLPPATDEELGGIKPGFGLSVNEDGTLHTTNILMGNTPADATPCGVFLQVCGVGGASTEPIPTMAEGVSYITSEGNMIDYVSGSGLYQYANCSTDGHIEYNLPASEIKKKFSPGLELVDVSEVTWYICDAEPTYEYGVLSAGDGFIYDTTTGYHILAGYLDINTFLKKFNAGELKPGRIEVEVPVVPTIGDGKSYIDKNGSIIFHYDANPYVGNKDCYEYWQVTETVSDNKPISMTIHSNDETITDVHPMSELAVVLNDNTNTFKDITKYTWRRYKDESLNTYVYAMDANGDGFLYAVSITGSAQIELSTLVGSMTEDELEASLTDPSIIKDAVFVDPRQILVKNLEAGKSYVLDRGDLYLWNAETESYFYRYNPTASDASADIIKTSMTPAQAEAQFSSEFSSYAVLPLHDITGAKWYHREGATGIFGIAADGTGIKMNVYETASSDGERLSTVTQSNIPAATIQQEVSYPLVSPLKMVNGCVSTNTDGEFDWENGVSYVTPVGCIVLCEADADALYTLYETNNLAAKAPKATAHLTRAQIEAKLTASSQYMFRKMSEYNWYCLADSSGAMKVYALNRTGVGFRYIANNLGTYESCNIGVANPIITPASGFEVINDENVVTGTFIAGGFLPSTDDASLVAEQSYLLSNSDTVEYHEDTSTYTMIHLQATDDSKICKYAGLTRDEVRIKMFPDITVFANLELVAWHVLKGQDTTAWAVVTNTEDSSVDGFEYRRMPLVHGSEIIAGRQGLGAFSTNLEGGKTEPVTYQNGYLLKTGETIDSKFADNTSYITSHGNIIEYIEDTIDYTYVSVTTEGCTVTSGLTKDQVKELLEDGTTLMPLADIEWLGYPYEEDLQYVVARTTNNVGFIYFLNEETQVISSLREKRGNGAILDFYTQLNTKTAEYDTAGHINLEDLTVPIEVAGFTSEKSHLLSNGKFATYYDEKYKFFGGRASSSWSNLTERQIRKALSNDEGEIVRTFDDVTWKCNTSNKVVFALAMANETAYAFRYTYSGNIDNADVITVVLDTTKSYEQVYDEYTALDTTGSLIPLVVDFGTFIVQQATPDPEPEPETPTT